MTDLHFLIQFPFKLRLKFLFFSVVSSVHVCILVYMWNGCICSHAALCMAGCVCPCVGM